MENAALCDDLVEKQLKIHATSVSQVVRLVTTGDSKPSLEHSALVVRLAMDWNAWTLMLN